MTPRFRRRRSGLGQALVELAVALPVLALLLLGSGQVGAIAYGMVTADTAAREGARVGSENPQTALAPLNGGSYTCVYATDSLSSGNPICRAVYESHGLLTASSFTVTISTNVSMSSYVPPTDVVRTTQISNCTTDVEVDGTITRPSGVTGAVTISASGQGAFPTTTVASGATSFYLCLAHNTTQTLNASISPTGCGGYAASSTVTVGNKGQEPFFPDTNPIALQANVCPTPTPMPTPTPTPTPTPAPTPTPTAAPTPPPFTCSNSNASSTEYFTVTVTYPVPIFVPILGNVLGSNGVRNVSATLTERLDPCTITQTK